MDWSGRMTRSSVSIWSLTQLHTRTVEFLKIRTFPCRCTQIEANRFGRFTVQLVSLRHVVISAGLFGVGVSASWLAGLLDLSKNTCSSSQSINQRLGRRNVIMRARTSSVQESFYALTCLWPTNTSSFFLMDYWDPDSLQQLSSGLYIWISFGGSPRHCPLGSWFCLMTAAVQMCNQSLQNITNISEIQTYFICLFICEMRYGRD